MEIDIHDVLRGMIPADVESILDVGCGSQGTILKIVPDTVKQIVGIDVDWRGIEASRALGMNVKLCDMREIYERFGLEAFDLVMFKDSLEHVPKAAADGVVGQAKDVARRYVMAFVPVGALGDEPQDEGPFKHRHHWQPDELRALGFTVTVIEGYRGPGKDVMIGLWTKQ